MQTGAFGPMPAPWLDFVEYLLLYREANELITRTPLQEDPRLTALRQRAVEAIEPQ